jgi:hypothetical protein
VTSWFVRSVHKFLWYTKINISHKFLISRGAR